MKDLDRQNWRIPYSLSLLPKVSVHPSTSKAYTPRSATRRANCCFPSSSTASKKLVSFPHNGQPVNDFGETTQSEEVACQKVNTFIFNPLVVDQFADISQCYETCTSITTDSFVLDIVKHGIKLDFVLRPYVLITLLAVP